MQRHEQVQQFIHLLNGLSADVQYMDDTLTTNHKALFSESVF